MKCYKTKEEINKMHEANIKYELAEIDLMGMSDRGLPYQIYKYKLMLEERLVDIEIEETLLEELI